MEPASMTRALNLAIMLTCLGVPPAFVIATAVPWYVDHRTSGGVRIDGVDRDYIVHVPRGYDGTKPLPLVLSLHGAGSWPSFQKDVTGWNAVADQHGFIAAYPGGRGAAFKIFGLSDAHAIAAVIDKLQASFNVDPSRIYVNGLSNGGGMSDVLSCVLADRIAAIGAVAAALTMTSPACRSARPLPMIAFHGTDDPVTRFHGGTVFIAPDPFPDITAWVSKWARRNRCSASTSESRVTPDVTRIAYENCSEPVVFYRIEGGGHTWPGGMPLPEWFAGPTNRSINASELMWNFFEAHALHR
jgi:polyhydroxybutyrate depolymerase